MNVVIPNTTGQIEDARLILREYYDELLKIDTSVQEFNDEVAGLPGNYAPPDGALLLAVEGQEAAGCVALKKIEDGLCEMKRLFVKPEYRGHGFGRLLAERIIEEAIELGYASMRLDTLDWLKESICLYQSLGFKQIPPYDINPPPGLVYWELKLKNSNCP
ncbi:MAG: GNAT family N-acetyltransferase [Gammaproteobacteria bacterium]